MMLLAALIIHCSQVEVYNLLPSLDKSQTCAAALIRLRPTYGIFTPRNTQLQLTVSAFKGTAEEGALHLRL